MFNLHRLTAERRSVSTGDCCPSVTEGHAGGMRACSRARTLCTTAPAESDNSTADPSDSAATPAGAPSDAASPTPDPGSWCRGAG